ncbi:MAG: D-2-hydroxyacid dehydrogenase [Acidimicrobiales bacterium]|nr:D-2-hydroxyacid dehydrogenase [Acidimicrobiales bacterium]
MTIVVWPLDDDETQPLMLRIPRHWIGPIAAAAGDVPVIGAAGIDDAAAAASDATGWIGALAPELLDRAPKLRWLQAPTISLEALQFPELESSDVVVTNMRNIYDDHIANHVIALLLAHCRQLPRFFRQQLRHEWSSGYVDNRAIDPADLTVLIQGLGGIGSELARRLTVFGPHVIGVDPQAEAAPQGVHELARPHQLDELLGRADVVVVAAPQTPETIGSWGEPRFRAMREGAYFINIARGPMVHLDALERALIEGWIGGAALDVTDPEPLPADSALWTMDNVLITPHSAGAGPGTDQRRLDVVTDNVGRFVSGTPLRNVADLARGY